MGSGLVVGSGRLESVRLIDGSGTWRGIHIKKAYMKDWLNVYLPYTWGDVGLVFLLRKSLMLS
jgi:hypothetical protein